MDKETKELIEDMGILFFNDHDVPGWLEDMATLLIEKGWKKVREPSSST